jgi:nucleoside phosphorylase
MTKMTQRQELADALRRILARLDSVKSSGQIFSLASLVDEYLGLVRKWGEGRLPPLPRSGVDVTELGLPEKFAFLAELQSVVATALSEIVVTGDALEGVTEKVDVLVVTALSDPEQKAVLRTGGGLWVEMPGRDDDHSVYYKGSYRMAGGEALVVVSVSPLRMGMVASAVLATKAIARFRPRLVAMVGIAAGARSAKQGYGDILAPDRTFDYGAGRVEEDGPRLVLMPDPAPLTVDPRLVAKLKQWEARPERLVGVQTGWDGKPPPTQLRVHVGPLGSGAAVIASSTVVDEVRGHWRKLVGLEMEAYGVHVACEEAVYPPVPYLCFKSVCDFADAHKGDDWQHYAAYTAAYSFEAFITAEWESLRF